MLPIPSPRRMPWEVLVLIINEADPSTLAVLGRVSFDILATTTLLLYRDVVVKSLRQVELMFFEKEGGRRTKNSSKSSRLNPLLSLSQIQNLSFDFTTTISTLPSTLPSANLPPSSSLNISSSRLTNSDPLHLQTLQVSYQYSPKDSKCAPPRFPISLLYDSVFHLLNPRSCKYKVVGRTRQDGGRVWNSVGSKPLVKWTRLEEVELDGILPYVFISREEGYFAGLPAPTLAQRHIIRIRPSALEVALGSGFHSLIKELGVNYRELGLKLMQDRSILLVVNSEEEKMEAEEAVRTSDWLVGCRKVFAVEVGV